MKLYHYTSGVGLFGIINSTKLHCSRQRFLNDPTEQSYFDNLLRSVLDKNELLKTIYIELFNKRNQQGLSNQKYIFSLSKNPDSLSLWNYYANGNGYNIGFKINSIIRRNKQGIEKVEMIYEIKEQERLIKSYVKSYTKKFHEYNKLTNKMIESDNQTEINKCSIKQRNIKNEFTNGIHKLSKSFKHSAYKDEQEVRLIIDKKSHVQFKVSDQGVFIEYLTLDMLLKKDVFEVTVHPLCSEIHVEGLERFIGSNISGDKINIRKSKIPLRLI